MHVAPCPPRPSGQSAKLRKCHYNRRTVRRLHVGCLVPVSQTLGGLSPQYPSLKVRGWGAGAPIYSPPVPTPMHGTPLLGHVGRMEEHGLTKQLLSVDSGWFRTYPSGERLAESHQTGL